MKNIFLFASFLLLSGCAATGVKIAQPIKRVGLFISLQNNVLCYRRTGITAFGNSLNGYPLSPDFFHNVETSFLEALHEKNMDVVVLDEDTVFGNHHIVNTSRWDGRKSITDPNVEVFKAVANKNNLDAVIVMEQDPPDDKSCNGVLYLGGDQYGMALSTVYAGVFTPKAEFSSMLYLSDGINNSPIIRQPKTLDPAYVANMENEIYRIIKNVVSESFPKSVTQKAPFLQGDTALSGLHLY